MCFTPNMMAGTQPSAAKPKTIEPAGVVVNSLPNNGQRLLKLPSASSFSSINGVAVGPVKDITRQFQ